jgi:thiamine-monophosphate kinase
VVARVLAAHRRPAPDYAAGPAAARAGATAMIDISDGLVRDALRVAQASGVRLELDSSALAPGADLLAVAALLPLPGVPQERARDWVMAGGEDHALLACFGAGMPLPAPFRPIGRVLEPAVDGEAQVLLDGEPWAGAAGWTHFSG